MGNSNASNATKDSPLNRTLKLTAQESIKSTDTNAQHVGKYLIDNSTLKPICWYIVILWIIRVTSVGNNSSIKTVLQCTVTRMKKLTLRTLGGGVEMNPSPINAFLTQKIEKNSF